jgi:hypothetical protein
MAVDNDNAPSSAPVASGSTEDSSKKGKAKEIKKVSSCFLFHRVSNHQLLFFQTPEKRPEVRFIEVSEIPGITISPRFQKYLTIKKFKADHPSHPPQENRSSE